MLFSRSQGDWDACTSAQMRMMRERRQKRGLRELRLVVPDPRLQSVRKRVAIQVGGLNQCTESEALSWIEAVSEFDALFAAVRSVDR